MKTNILKTYTCEICNTSYENEQTAELCEKSGIPESYDKFLGVWIIVPLQVLEESTTQDSSEILWTIKWALARINANYIKPLTPPIVANTMFNIRSIGHQVKYSISSFENRSYLFNSMMKHAVQVPEGHQAIVTSKLIELESHRLSLGEEGFRALQIKSAADALNSALTENNLAIDLDLVNDIKLEGLNNVSNKFNN